MGNLGQELEQQANSTMTKSNMGFTGAYDDVMTLEKNKIRNVENNKNIMLSYRAKKSQRQRRRDERRRG